MRWNRAPPVSISESEDNEIVYFHFVSLRIRVEIYLFLKQVIHHDPSDFDGRHRQQIALSMEKLCVFTEAHGILSYFFPFDFGVVNQDPAEIFSISFHKHLKSENNFFVSVVNMTQLKVLCHVERCVCNACCDIRRVLCNSWRPFYL